MADHASSASQDRALRLFSLAADSTYPGASAVLTAAGLSADGIPAGHTWRTAKKLSDGELFALFSAARAEMSPELTDDDFALAGARAATAPHDAYRPTNADLWRRNRQMTKERERQNAQLRVAGYRWQRNDDYGHDTMGGDEWLLIGPDGRIVELSDAIASLNTQEG